MIWDGELIIHWSEVRVLPGPPILRVIELANFIGRESGLSIFVSLYGEWVYPKSISTFLASPSPQISDGS
jgi:hypothetical protein